MERLHIELRFALQFDKSHCRSGGSLGDRFRVNLGIVLGLMRFLKTMFPARSKPARLQMFLPRSIPSTAISFSLMTLLLFQAQRSTMARW